MLTLAFTDDGWDDYQYWISTDRTILKRVNMLIKEARRDPTSGIGKPEQLKYLDGSPWSRRITQEHRMVYSFDNQQLTVWQCRYHYSPATQAPHVAHAGTSGSRGQSALTRGLGRHSRCGDEGWASC